MSWRSNRLNTIRLCHRFCTRYWLDIVRRFVYLIDRISDKKDFSHYENRAVESYVLLDRVLVPERDILFHENED